MAKFMNPPADAVIAPTGPTWLDADGIIITINNTNVHTLQQAMENIEIVKEIGKGKPRPLLADISRVQSMSKDAREAYVADSTRQVVSAVALLTSSNVGRMVGNLFISFNKHTVPVKLFTDAEKAKNWLLQYKTN